MASHANHVSGKVIIVTGAGGGFGRLVSQKTAAMGGSVVAADVDEGAAGGDGRRRHRGGRQGRSGRRGRHPEGGPGSRRGGRRRAVRRHRRAGEQRRRHAARVLRRSRRAWEAWDRAIDINLKGVVTGSPRSTTR